VAAVDLPEAGGAYIDRNGEVVLSGWRYTWPFSEGLAAVDDAERIGWIDSDGDYVIQPRFQAGWEFHDGLAPAMDDSGFWGYIDESGGWAIDPQFDEAWEFEDGLAGAVKGYGLGWIDTTGEWVWDPRD
jgi:hypothetical protein